jgi:isocitrate dehydrogenase
MPNLYGDILSDVAAQIAGSVGLAGSANIGKEYAMFEAIHGSAPRRAGQNLANPSGLLLGAVMMLVHIGQPEVAERVHNAWLAHHRGRHPHLRRGEGRQESIHQAAGRNEASSRRPSSSGSACKPQQLKPDALRLRAAARPSRPTTPPPPPSRRELAGVDVYIHHPPADPNQIGAMLQGVAGDGLDLIMITNRGVKVFPDPLPATLHCDTWRCRFQPKQGGAVTPRQILSLLDRCLASNIEVVKTEHLYSYDGKPGYSLGQGQ